jgi:hypothetical protein
LVIRAKVEFLKIPRPPYGYRYTGKNCWMRLDSEAINDVACCLSFEDGEEYYDEDCAELLFSFYKNDPRIHEISVGMKFSLRVLDLKVATGAIVSVTG